MVLFERGKGILGRVWGMIRKYTSLVLWLLNLRSGQTLLIKHILFPIHSKQDPLANQALE